MKTILLVDDTQELRDLMQFQIEKAGFKVVTAQNGAEALRLFKAIPEIQAIVTDLEMPIMNGIQLVQAVREIDAQVPIVMWSGAINPNIASISFFQKEEGYKPIIQVLKGVA